MSWKKRLAKNKRSLWGGVFGALTGFLYWHFIGCNSGSCAITSSPLISTLYFAVMGIFAASAFGGVKKKEQGVE